MARYHPHHQDGHHHRRSVDLQLEEHDSTTFAPGRTREREFDFEYTERSNRERGNAGALIPVPRHAHNTHRPEREFKEHRDITETIDIQRGPYHERDRYVEHDVYDSRAPAREDTREISVREEINCTPPHYHRNRAGDRIQTREHTSECICLECVRNRRYGQEYQASGSLIISRDYAPPVKETRQVERERERERNRDRRTIGYGKYDKGYYSRTEKDVSEVIPFDSPRNSGFLLSSQQHQHQHEHEATRSSGMLANYTTQQGSQDWTVVDVPPGTRRVTVEPGSGPTEMLWSNEREQVVEKTVEKSIRRTRGGQSESTTQGELWTEITKDLVTAEALGEFGYQYEETEFYYYIFEYLHRDQIQELIELTKDIRRERVKDIEYHDRMERDRSSISSVDSRPMRKEQGSGYYERDRYESREVYYT